MKIKVLGCGNFSSVKHHNTAMLVEPESGDSRETLLFDCGRDIKFSLADFKEGVKPSRSGTSSCRTSMATTSPAWISC